MGSLSFIWTFAVFLLCNVIARILIQQIELGYISRPTLFLTYVMELLNFFGIQMFLVGVAGYQETFRWTGSFGPLPSAFALICFWIYSLIWGSAMVGSTNLRREWEVVRKAYVIASPYPIRSGIRGGLIGFFTIWIGVSRVQYRFIFEHFNCKPLRTRAKSIDALASRVGLLGPFMVRRQFDRTLRQLLKESADASAARRAAAVRDMESGKDSAPPSPTSPIQTGLVA